jgi:cytochrome P450
MRLITPKRLKENEEFMWKLADRVIDEFVGRGECEFIHDYAGPFTLLVIADLLGVPEEQHEQFRKELQGAHKPTQGPDGKMKHKPLEFLYERFTKFIEDRRREPRDDVMTRMAQATFADGSLPEVHDIMLIASNLFSAGGETTARLLGVMFQQLGENPALQPDPEARGGVSADCDPAAVHLPAVARASHDRRRRDRAGNHGDAAAGRGEHGSARVRRAQPAAT